MDAAKGRVEAVKDYGLNQVSRSLETPVAKFAFEKVNEALTLSEEYIEKYLPESEGEADAGMEASSYFKSTLQLLVLKTHWQTTFLKILWGKGENAGNQHFLPSPPQYFLSYQGENLSFSNIKFVICIYSQSGLY